MALWPGARRGACELGGIGVRGTTMSRGGFYRRISFVFSICLVITVVKEGGHVRSAKRRREFLPARRGALLTSPTALTRVRDRVRCCTLVGGLVNVKWAEQRSEVAFSHTPISSLHGPIVSNFDRPCSKPHFLPTTHAPGLATRGQLRRFLFRPSHGHGQRIRVAPLPEIINILSPLFTGFLKKYHQTHIQRLSPRKPAGGTVSNVSSDSEKRGGKV
jgi:hypothetical protein